MNKKYVVTIIFLLTLFIVVLGVRAGFVAKPVSEQQVGDVLTEFVEKNTGTLVYDDKNELVVVRILPSFSVTLMNNSCDATNTSCDPTMQVEQRIVTSMKEYSISSRKKVGVRYAGILYDDDTKVCNVKGVVLR